MRRWFIIDPRLREGEPGDGGGGGGDRKPDVAVQIEGLIASHGSAKGALGTLYRENYELREERRGLREKLDGMVPDGGRILTAEQATAWNAYQELGKPEDLTKELEAKKSLEAKDQKRERDKLRAEAAAASSYEAGVLGRLLDDGDELEVREETVNGEKVKVAYITPAGDGQKPVRLTEHAAEQWEEFLPALEAEPEAGRAPGEARRMIRQSPRGTRSPKGPKSKDDIAESKRGASEYAAF